MPGGARVRIFGADNPDALRGLYFDGVVLDEVAQMKPELWGEIIRPALALTFYAPVPLRGAARKGVRTSRPAFNQWR